MRSIDKGCDNNPSLVQEESSTSQYYCKNTNALNTNMEISQPSSSSSSSQMFPTEWPNSNVIKNSYWRPSNTTSASMFESPPYTSSSLRDPGRILSQPYMPTMYDGNFQETTTTERSSDPAYRPRPSVQRNINYPSSESWCYDSNPVLNNSNPHHSINNTNTNLNNHYTSFHNSGLNEQASNQRTTYVTSSQVGGVSPPFGVQGSGYRSEDRKMSSSSKPAKSDISDFEATHSKKKAKANGNQTVKKRHLNSKGKIEEPSVLEGEQLHRRTQILYDLFGIDVTEAYISDAILDQVNSHRTTASQFLQAIECSRQIDRTKIEEQLQTPDSSHPVDATSQLNKESLINTEPLHRGFLAMELTEWMELANRASGTKHDQDGPSAIITLTLSDLTRFIEAILNQQSAIRNGTPIVWKEVSEISCLPVSVCQKVWCHAEDLDYCPDVKVFCLPHNLRQPAISGYEKNKREAEYFISCFSARYNKLMDLVKSVANTRMPELDMSSRVVKNVTSVSREGDISYHALGIMNDTHQSEVTHINKNNSSSSSQQYQNNYNKNNTNNTNNISNISNNYYIDTNSSSCDIQRMGGKIHEGNFMSTNNNSPKALRTNETITKGPAGQSSKVDLSPGLFTY